MLLIDSNFNKENVLMENEHIQQICIYVRLSLFVVNDKKERYTGIIPII